MKYSALAMLALLTAWIAPIYAECMRWPDFLESTSANGQITVRVTFAKNLANVSGLADSSNGDQYPTAEWYRLNGNTLERVRTITLLKPTSPSTLRPLHPVFVVTDDGTLITLNNPCEDDIGDVLVIYSPSGNVVRRYSLSDLYSREDIRRFELGSKGLPWRCKSAFRLALKSQGELWALDSIGGHLIIRFDTGAISYEQGQSVPEPIEKDDDPELMDVQVTGTRLRPPNAAPTPFYVFPERC